MINQDIDKKVLFDPLKNGVNELYILSGYATHNMLSWYIKNLPDDLTNPIKISLLYGMASCDGVSKSVHKGFVELVKKDFSPKVSNIECSYIYEGSAVHSNVLIWAKDGDPIEAYTGSAYFTQKSFVGIHRQETMVRCNPKEAMDFYQSCIDRSIYVQHSEVEDCVKIYAKHPILDHETDLRNALEQEGVKLSLLSRNGEPGDHSGLNWGQRENRNPNEAYIPLPAAISKKGYFPLEKKHFTALTDDGFSLILRVEQENNKAITTPERNSDLGEYFRRRLGLANGSKITKANLNKYGRTDVIFLRLDEETYYMDFSEPR